MSMEHQNQRSEPPDAAILAAYSRRLKALQGTEQGSQRQARIATLIQRGQRQAGLRDLAGFCSTHLASALLLFFSASARRSLLHNNSHRKDHDHGHD